MRPIGDIYLDLEKLYDELVDDHGVQMGDLIYWLYGHLKIHRPDCIEEYVADGSNPTLYYGPTPDRNKLKRQIVKYLREFEGCRMNMKDAEAILKMVEKEQK